MTDQPTRAALVGCGAISKLHLDCMRQAGLAIAAVCDLDEARAEGRKAEFGDESTQVFSDYEKMLAEVQPDVVGIATPPVVHEEQVVAALEAGAMAYCEKPVVKSLSEFDAIFAAEEKSGKRAYFTPGRFRGGQTPLIKQYIDDGDLGTVYRADAKHIRQRGRPGVDTNPDARWFADSRKAIAGITGDMGLYFMDRSFYLTGWPTVAGVAAMTYKEFPFEVPADVVYDVEEHVVMLVRTEGKLTFTFEFANIAYHDPVMSSLTLMGTEGGIMQEGRSEGFRYCTEKGGPWQFVTHTSTWSEKRKADAVIYEQLGAAARNGSVVTMATSSREALVLHEIMQMAFRSARAKSEVRPGDLDRAEPIFLRGET